MSSTGSVIGQRIPKLDAPGKVTGRSTYGHDVRLPGMLHGRILYSRYPHARILHIETSRAEQLRGVKAVLTAADNPPAKFGYGKDSTPFKAGLVRSRRDEVAGVVATDPDIAEEALALIKVEYEPLPAVLSTAEALAPAAPVLHPEKGSNLFHTFHYEHGSLTTGEAESAVIVEASYKLPYVAHACLETSVVVAQFDQRGHLTVWSMTQIPFLLQRDLAEALDMPGSHIRVIQTTIGGSFGRGLDIYPFEPIAALMARKAGQPVRLAFSRPEEFIVGPMRQPIDVTVRAGARRDGLLTFRDVATTLDVGAYASWGATTPLVMLSTTASLYQAPHARFKADCVYTNNPVTGAMRGYGNPQSTFFVETIMDQLAEALAMDPIDFRLRNANQPNTTTPQGLIITSCGLRECLQAVAAAADRSDGRMGGWEVGRMEEGESGRVGEWEQGSRGAGEMKGVGETLELGNNPKSRANEVARRGQGPLWEIQSQRSGPERPRPPVENPEPTKWPGEAKTPRGKSKTGIGFAATLNVGGGARIYRSDGCGAIVKVDDFGRVSLISGSTEIGQGSETALAQIVAEVLGVGVTEVNVINSDTDVKPWDVGVHASRTTFIAGNAAYLAALQARDQIFETAAEMLQATPAELMAGEGRVMVRSDPQRAVELSKVVRRRHLRQGGQVIIGEGWYDPPTQLVDKDSYKGNISATYGFGAQMAEVEVDTETGAVRVLRLVCAHDMGRAINPMTVEGQIEGGAQMGLGYALTEELIVREGAVLNPDFLDYRLFTAADMPQIETILIETDDPSGPFGAKGVGEMGGTPTAAAIANAIYDAAGIRLTHLPMTPERVLAALEEKRRQE